MRSFDHNPRVSVYAAAFRFATESDRTRLGLVGEVLTNHLASATVRDPRLVYDETEKCFIQPYPVYPGDLNWRSIVHHIIDGPRKIERAQLAADRLADGVAATHLQNLDAELENDRKLEIANLLYEQALRQRGRGQNPQIPMRTRFATRLHV